MVCDKKPEKIKDMFNEMAPYYDKINNFISFGTHYIIKWLTIRDLNPEQGTMLLDLCCGTGDYTKILSKFYNKVDVIGLDVSKNMLKLAKEKNPKGTFMQGDCTALPFRDGEFQYITMGFGLRNIEDRKTALSEIYRVLDNGGIFMHLDFGKHNSLSKVFDIIVPLVAFLCGKKQEHYKYLLSSKNEFPEPVGLVREFKAAGFKFKKRRDYLFGTISAQYMEKIS